jgi:hypothetical protein
MRREPSPLQGPLESGDSELPDKLIAEEDHVPAIAGQEFLIRITRIPDARFRHEIEAGSVNHSGPFPLTIPTEEDRCSENPLK